ncbi:MAG: D-alanine--D-alanine ligase [Spirochaetales bacterium]|nr:D-alanine--D-alanine ligase [Spirochaetales bacterium]
MPIMKHIVLIYGGRSGEHEVSLRSGAFIYRNLKKGGFLPIPVGISREGNWFLQHFAEEPADILPLAEETRDRISLTPGEGLTTADGTPVPCDMVFPVIHGTFGEDGTLQGLLEMLNLPYVGAGIQSSVLGMDKICAKQIWESDGLPVVPYRSLSRAEKNSPAWKERDFFGECSEALGLPLFIKPSRAGSSVGVTKAVNEASFYEGVENALKYDREILIEKSIAAREIECSLLGNRDARIFGPGEIAPSHDFYDYEAKYIDPDGAALLIPAPLDETLKEKIRDTARKAYSSLKLNGLARLDIFLEKDSERFYINEVNTMPGFTSISMFPMLCAAEGLEGPDLIRELIELGREEFELKNELIYKK